MRCAKKRYRTRLDARIAMALARDGKRQDGSLRPKQERRAYRCPQCHGWHLTSLIRNRSD